MTAAPNFMSRAVEYFTLRAAEAELERLPELARAEIAEGIELSRQQTAAAEALFAVGHTVEALRLGKEALASTQKAAERYALARGLSPKVEAPAETKTDAATEAPAAASTETQTEPASDGDESDAVAEEAPPAKPAPVASPAWKRLAEASGRTAKQIGTIERILVDVDKLALPRLEKDVAPAHVDAFRELLRARAEIEDTLLPATLTKGSLLGARIWRGVSTGLLTLLVLGALIYLVRPVEGTFVRASATWADSPDFRPDFIIDGSDASMWLLPEHTGWVEVRVAPPIASIHRITLVNAGSTAIPDRGTHEYRLEIYADGRLEQSIDGSFGEELGATASHDVDVRNVERIRFVARSGYRIGSGLSEMRWE